jgi:hypothetical protein
MCICTIWKCPSPIYGVYLCLRHQQMFRLQNFPSYGKRNNVSQYRNKNIKTPFNKRVLEDLHFASKNWLNKVVKITTPYSRHIVMQIGTTVCTLYILVYSIQKARIYFPQPWERNTFMGPQTEGVHSGQWPNPPRATRLIALHRDCLTKGLVSPQIFRQPFRN